MKLETRKLALAPSLRAGEAGDGLNAPHLVGHAAKFNVDSCVLCEADVNDGRPFVEVLARGCFGRSLAEMPDVRALVNHDTTLLLGRTASGTLVLVEDDIGLNFDLELPDTSWGRDYLVLVRRGDITGCSFGFCVVEDRFEQRADGVWIRTILDLDLYEISPVVAFPAYEDTEVALRSRRRGESRSNTRSLPRLAHALRMLRLLGDD